MSKVTSKLQVTIPKSLAERYGIRPGDEIDWEPAGEAIRVIPAGRRRPELDKARKLRLFDAAAARQREREARLPAPPESPPDRGWTRDELYTRGSS